MAKRVLTVNEQVRKLNQQQQAIDRKLQRLAPAGALEYAGTTDANMLTWREALWAVDVAVVCLVDLSMIQDLDQAEKEAAAKAPVAAGT